jgi:hypothetical protein
MRRSTAERYEADSEPLAHDATDPVHWLATPTDGRYSVVHRRAALARLASATVVVEVVDPGVGLGAGTQAAAVIRATVADASRTRRPRWGVEEESRRMER